MPQTLEFHLLGGLRIGLNGEAPFRFASRRAGVMLAYIAMNQQPYSRESLAVLLWDDRDPKQAMANLRSLLAQLPKALKPYLTITRQTVSFSDKMPVWVDALMFLETEDWRQEADFAQFPVSNPPIPQLEEAAALYVGGFLEGVFVRESWRLEEWTAVTRERLQQHAIQTRSQLAYTYFYRREYAPAIQHTQALLALDPLREGSHRLLIRLLARDGQLNAAIQQYEQCRAILDDELGVSPSPQTRALYERLLSAKLKRRTARRT
jgi:DNA-binding SARP family transcriptional activator